MISTGRTALVLVPLLLLILGFRLFGWRGVIAALLVATVVAFPISLVVALNSLQALRESQAAPTAT